MPVDMLVDLSRLPDPTGALAKVSSMGIETRRARPREMKGLVRWVAENFSQGWASECRVALSRMPPSCFVAAAPMEFVGFACFDVAQRGVFGPMGVQESWRRKGIGSALLLLSLKSMAEMGYRYAVIGEVGPVEFYRKVVLARVIDEDSA
jgi:GNAT superfamily N-acetyltransferase